MSADNGIYILKTQAEKPIIESDFEYRVIKAVSIDNIYWDPVKGDYREDDMFTPEIAFEYFGTADVFISEYEAQKEAAALAKNVVYLEYGICLLDHSDQIFKAFSIQEMKEYKRREKELLEQHRQQRQREIDEDIERRTITLTKGTSVIVKGYVEFPDPEDSSKTIVGMIKNHITIPLNSDVKVIKNK